MYYLNNRIKLVVLHYIGVFVEESAGLLNRENFHPSFLERKVTIERMTRLWKRASKIRIRRKYILSFGFFGLF
jgi:hypothetical protein